MDDNNIQVYYLEFPGRIKGLSVFENEIHYIFLNSALSEDLKEIALREELQRECPHIK